MFFPSTMTRPGIFAIICVLVALYCAVEFKTFKVDAQPVPAWVGIQFETDFENSLQKSDIRLLKTVQGPESIAFDPMGRGPYTGVANGKVLFWNGSDWIDFAYTSPHRFGGICDYKPRMEDYLNNEHICGRPLGLKFNKRTGDLYIADAYFGLMKVGPEGGLATPIVTEAEGVRMRFTNDLDISDDGNIYFTDSSTIYQRRYFNQIGLSRESSGRLLKYDPNMKKVTVLVRNLRFPNGVSLSKHGWFVVFCEGATARLHKYWLKGEKAGTSEIMATLPGYPDNVRRNENGDFWVAIKSRRTPYDHLFDRYPNLRLGTFHGMIVKYSPEGIRLRILEDRPGRLVRAISDVEERDGKLWMGSVLEQFIAVYQLD